MGAVNAKTSSTIGVQLNPETSDNNEHKNNYTKWLIVSDKEEFGDTINQRKRSDFFLVTENNIMGLMDRLPNYDHAIFDLSGNGSSLLMPVIFVFIVDTNGYEFVLYWPKTGSTMYRDLYDSDKYHSEHVITYHDNTTDIVKHMNDHYH